VVLTLPLHLEIDVAPALDPWGKPWRVVLMRREPSLAKLQDVGGGTTVDGRFMRRELNPGSYLLDVRDSEGASFLSEEVDLLSDTTLVRELSLVWVEGVVAQGDRPLATRLRFYTRSRSTPIRMDSDEKGLFSGILPREGSWRVDLPDLRRTLHNVRVERAKGARSAKLDLSIPDYRLAGEVVDETSKPFAGATVTAGPLAEDIEQSAQSDEEGAFLIDAVSATPHLLLAEAETGGRVLSSDPIIVTPTKDRSNRALRLVLREKKRLEGVVSSLSGPVPGARVEATQKGQLNLSTSEVSTDQAGRFHLDVPASATELQLLVRPPGFTLRTLTLTAPFPEPVAITVDDSGGTIIFRTPAMDLSDSLAPHPLAVIDGQPLSLSSLLGWARAAGQGKQDKLLYTIPRMEAGEYSACMVGFSEESRVVLGLAQLTGEICSHGTLAPHGELVLDLTAGPRVN